MKHLFGIALLIIFGVSLTAQTAIPPAIGDGTEANPYQIASLDNLYWITASDQVVEDPNQAVRWSSHYIQTAYIDASDTANWFAGQGWDSIGYWLSPEDFGNFSGSYDGQGYTINGLYINRPNTSNIGLFGRVEGGTIKNLGLTNVDITGQYMVGSLVGLNLYDATISNSYSTGNVNGILHVGGLVGINYYYCTVTDSYSTCNITGSSNSVGGLVGTNTSSYIYNSYSTGNVAGASYVGGLVGWSVSSSTIINCYSTGSVAANARVGGLVGTNENDSVIKNSHSTGGVIAYGTSSCGTSNAGGLLGLNRNHSEVINSYSTGDVVGTERVGGLVGESFNSSNISYSYSTGNVIGTMNSIGGLIGLNFTSTITNSYSSGNVDGNWRVGGLAGSSVGTNAAIVNCYSTGYVDGNTTVGGLIGYITTGTVTNSYWDTETSNQATSAAGEGRTTAEMTYPHAANTYVNWDFDEIWEEDEQLIVNNGYPFLIWHELPGLEQVVVNILVMDNHVILNWDPVSNANTYKIYASEDPLAENWGDPIAITEDNAYREVITSSRKFYRIIASTDSYENIRNNLHLQ